MKKLLIAVLALTVMGGIATPVLADGTTFSFTPPPAFIPPPPTTFVPISSSVNPTVIAEVIAGLAVIKTNLIALQQVELGKLTAIQTVIIILQRMTNDLLAIRTMPDGTTKDTQIALITAKVAVATNVVMTLKSIDATERQILLGMIAEVQALANRLK